MYLCIVGADIPTNIAPTKLQPAGRVLLVNGCKSSRPQAEMYVVGFQLFKKPGVLVFMREVLGGSLLLPKVLTSSAWESPLHGAESVQSSSQHFLKSLWEGFLAKAL